MKKQYSNFCIKEKFIRSHKSPRMEPFTKKSSFPKDFFYIAPKSTGHKSKYDEFP